MVVFCITNPRQSKFAMSTMSVIRLHIPGALPYINDGCARRNSFKATSFPVPIPWLGKGPGNETAFRGLKSCFGSSQSVQPQTCHSGNFCDTF